MGGGGQRAQKKYAWLPAAFDYLLSLPYTKVEGNERGLRGRARIVEASKKPQKKETGVSRSWLAAVLFGVIHPYMEMPFTMHRGGMEH